MLTEADKMYLAKFLEDERFDRILGDIIEDLGKQIMNSPYTEPNVRERYYSIGYSIRLLKRKLQECSNIKSLEGDMQDDNK